MRRWKKIIKKLWDVFCSHFSTKWLIERPSLILDITDPNFFLKWEASEIYIAMSCSNFPDNRLKLWTNVLEVVGWWWWILEVVGDACCQHYLQCVCLYSGKYICINYALGPADSPQWTINTQRELHLWQLWIHQNMLFGSIFSGSGRCQLMTSFFIKNDKLILIALNLTKGLNVN